MWYGSIYRRRKLREKWAFCQKVKSASVVHRRVLVYYSQQAKNAFQACVLGINQRSEKWSMSVCIWFMQALVYCAQNAKSVQGYDLMRVA
jgi:hypothetical protein